MELIECHLTFQVFTVNETKQLRIIIWFLPARRSKRGNSYGNVSGWVAGWLSDTLRYCIKTAKPIRKSFQPS